MNLRFLMIFGCMMGSATAAPTSNPFVPEFRFSEPFSATRLAAERAGLALDGFAAPDKRSELIAGDTITAIVTLTESNSATQWIVQLKAVDLTAKEKQAPALSQWRLYTTTGREFDFAGKLAALEIRMIGPAKSNAPTDEKAAQGAKDRKVRIQVNSEYLRLGFDRACKAWLRVQQLKAHDALFLKENHGWACNSRKFTAEELVKGKRDGELMGLTETEERAMAGTLPALVAFFGIALQTSELRDVLREVAEIPWWQLVKHGGEPQINMMFLPQFGQGWPQVWRLPAGEGAWYFPVIFNLFDKPAVACRLAVTEPKPPLLTSAGIIGVAAQRPDGKGPHLMIQVIATRGASENLEKISVK
ncbi:MAG: hypothetical protein QM715_17690 [Nibricoccus sp.]